MADTTVTSSNSTITTSSHDGSEGGEAVTPVSNSAIGRKILLAVDDSEVSALAFTWALTNVFRSPKPLGSVESDVADAAADSAVIVTTKIFVSPVAMNPPSVDLVAGGEAMLVGSEEEMLAGGDSVEGEVAVERHAEALVNKFMRQCKQFNIVAEGVVVEGDPGPCIVKEAEKHLVDAIVLGSHGRGVFGRTLYGSISDYVLHHTQVPVMIVRSPKEASQTRDPLGSTGGPRTIAISVDESKEAQHAFKWAVDNFVRDDDRVVILHVQTGSLLPTALGVDQFGNEDVYIPPDLTEAEAVTERVASEKLVEGFLQAATAKSKAKFEGRVVAGSTGDKLCDELATISADVAVIGSHGKDVLTRTFLGSVSDHVAHNSPCPLIVVKIPKVTPPSQGEPHAHDV